MCKRKLIETYEDQLSSWAWAALEISWCSCSILTFTDDSTCLKSVMFANGQFFSFWNHDWPEHSGRMLKDDTHRPPPSCRHDCPPRSPQPGWLWLSWYGASSLASPLPRHLSPPPPAFPSLQQLPWHHRCCCVCLPISPSWILARLFLHLKLCHPQFVADLLRIWHVMFLKNGHWKFRDRHLWDTTITGHDCCGITRGAAVETGSLVSSSLAWFGDLLECYML